MSVLQKPEVKVTVRYWSTILSATVASIPALLVGCTLAFPSGALLDLVGLEERSDFKFDRALSNVFGVSEFRLVQSV